MSLRMARRGFNRKHTGGGGGGGGGGVAFENFATGTLPSDITSSGGTVAIDTGTGNAGNSLKATGTPAWYFGTRFNQSGDFVLNYDLMFSTGDRNISEVMFYVNSPSGTSFNGFKFRLQANTSTDHDGGLWKQTGGSQSGLANAIDAMPNSVWLNVMLSVRGTMFNWKVIRQDTGATVTSGSYDLASSIDGSHPQSGGLGDQGYSPGGASAHWIDNVSLVPYVVASCSGHTDSGTSFTTSALPNAPIAGDVLVAAINISQYLSSRDLTIPSGWTAIDTGGTSNSDGRLRVIKRVCDGTEGTTFTFNITGSGQTHSGIVHQVRGASGVVDAFAEASASSTTATAPHANALPLAYFAQNDGTTDGNTTNTIATAGWTTDKNEAPGYHSIVGGHKAITAASDVVAPTCTWGGTLASPLSAVVVLAKAVPPVPAPVQGSGQLKYIRGASSISGNSNYTPPANALMVVTVACDADNAGVGRDCTITDTWGGLSWTRVQQKNGDLTTAVFYASTGSAPSNGTFTVTFSGGVDTARADCYTVAKSSAVGTTGTATGSNTTGSTANLAVTLGAAPAPTSRIIGVLGTINNNGGASVSGITDPSGFTNLETVGIGSFSDNDATTLDLSHGQQQATGLTWVLPASQNITQAAAVAIEVSS